jgi:hypothetical protein
VKERQEQLFGLVSSLLPENIITLKATRDDGTWGKNIPKLLNFIEEIVGREHSLYKFIGDV